jgi:hypothetical protein
LEIIRLELGEKGNHAVAIVAGAERFNLSIAKEIGDFRNFFGSLESDGIVRFEVVAVGAVKNVYVPEIGVIALLNDL